MTSLGDPGADRVLGWDDTDNSYAYFVIGSGLTYTHATHTLSSSGGGGTPGGSDTQVQFNDGGSFGGAALQYDKTQVPHAVFYTPNSDSGGAILFTAASAISDGNGRGITFDGGVGTGTGRSGGTFLVESGGADNNGGASLKISGGNDDDNHGGVIQFVAGNSITNGIGGSQIFTSGDGGSTSGQGGSLSFNGGNARGGDSDGGSQFFSAGNGIGAGVGGSVISQAGLGGGGNMGALLNLIGGDSDDTNTGGAFVGNGGTGTDTGNGGAISFTAGFSGNGATGNGGLVQLRAGDSTSTNGSGGDLIFIAGSKTGSGTDGKFQFRTGGSTNFANLDTSILSSTDKTFTFPDQSGTIALVSNTTPVSHARATAQTAANTNILTVSVPASDTIYQLLSNVLVTASTAHSFGITVDYTDEGNTARTLTIPVAQLAGTLITAITNVTGAGPYEGVSLTIRAKASTNIVFKTAGTFTTVTYNVDASVVQIA